MTGYRIGMASVAAIIAFTVRNEIPLLAAFNAGIVVTAVGLQALDFISNLEPINTRHERH